jgi:hypothetical protein
MPHLLHFSEDPNIEVFQPHVPASAPDNSPMVWAVDKEHAPGFWFPRDAPRACCWSTGKPMGEIAQSLLGMGAYRRMHAIETAWLERMRACKLYEYCFDATPFAIHDNQAGYFSTRETIRPLSVEPVGDLLSLHIAAGIELRIVPNLWPVIDSIVASGLQFSIIRKANARPRDSNSR